MPAWVASNIHLRNEGKHHIAARQSLTGCRIRRDPDAYVGLGKHEQSRQVEGHMPAWVVSNTHHSNEGTKYKHHMAGSKATTHQLYNQNRSRSTCRVGRKKTQQASQWGTGQLASQQLTSEHRGHITRTTWRAASQLLTGCRIRRDPYACVGWAKENKAGKSAGHIPEWPASDTHKSTEGTKQAAHGRQQANLSPAIEPGGIQMHTWGWVEENKTG